MHSWRVVQDGKPEGSQGVAGLLSMYALHEIMGGCMCLITRESVSIHIQLAHLMVDFGMPLFS